MKKKKFLNINELITYMKQKNIIIDNESIVSEILNSENYYVIMGYKTLFLNKNGKYKENTNFMDIYKLSEFDRKLRILLFDTLLTIENKIKVSIINAFCSKKETDFLDINNYNINHKYLNKTFDIMKRQIKEKESNNLAVLHYKEEYSFVPLWVYMKLFSFGLVKDIYNILKDEEKEEIKNKIATDKTVSIKHFYTMMNLLVDTRNDCGHDEIVFNHIHKRIRIGKTKFHEPFNSDYLGKSDTLAKLISIKYFLTREKFNELIDKITKLINGFVKVSNIKIEELLSEMHLPNNYEELKW